VAHYICKNGSPNNPFKTRGRNVTQRSSTAKRVGSAEAKRLPDMTNPNLTPAECRSMPELRGEIDRLDRDLVTLLAERQRYIERAAEIKHSRGAVHDQARIEDVVAKVLVTAREKGLSPDIAEPVWRTLIDRCIAHEFVAFDRQSAK
jgi:isochorismate pyruvate lyase